MSSSVGIMIPLITPKLSKYYQSFFNVLLT